MPLVAIVAMAKNRAIGKDNQLLWHLPDDLKHFRALTLGKTVLMGRKTLESIGHALPGRTNVVLSQDRHRQVKDCILVHTLEEALATVPPHEDLILIGGATLYEQLLPRTERIYLTEVEAAPEGDVFFPELNPDEWQEKDCHFHPADERHACAFRFITLDRVR